MFVFPIKQFGCNLIRAIMETAKAVLGKAWCRCMIQMGNLSCMKGILMSFLKNMGFYGKMSSIKRDIVNIGSTLVVEYYGQEDILYLP